VQPSQAAEDLLHVDVSANSVRSNAEILDMLRRAGVDYNRLRQQSTLDYHRPNDFRG
jgi:hypothetical protein